MNFRGLFKGMWGWTKRNSTKLLAAGAVVSQWIALWFMHKEAPIVKERLDALPENANWKDKAKVIIPVYWPAVGMMMLSSGCVIGGFAAGEKKAAIMASLYSASEASLRKLEDEVVKKVGKEKAQEIHDSIADEMAKEIPPAAENVEYTSFGGDLFWEPWTGRWFTSNMDAFEENNRKFQKWIMTNMWGSFNDWCEFQGISKAQAGDIVGWNVDHMFEWYTRGDDRSSDKKLYYQISFPNRPVLYNGKEPKAFSDCDACYID